jgi:hypothetical protein
MHHPEKISHVDQMGWKYAQPHPQRRGSENHVSGSVRLAQTYTIMPKLSVNASTAIALGKGIHRTVATYGNIVGK